jgi:hypothetical protein
MPWGGKTAARLNGLNDSRQARVGQAQLIAMRRGFRALSLWQLEQTESGWRAAIRQISDRGGQPGDRRSQGRNGKLAAQEIAAGLQL